MHLEEIFVSVSVLKSRRVCVLGLPLADMAVKES